MMYGTEEIVPAKVRKSTIISHSIGIPELAHLLRTVVADAPVEAYERAALDENVLGIGTQTGRRKRFASLRQLYLFRPESVLFRALRDLWEIDEEGRPLLAALCAMARDTVFRASTGLLLRTPVGGECTVADFRQTIEDAYPGVYAAGTLQKAAENAYASWHQSGHLGTAEGGRKRREQATCRPADVAYALLLGHLEGTRGETLFDSIWVRVLDQPHSRLQDLAFAASQQGMVEYRNAGRVMEVGFRALLRPVEGQLL